MTNRIVYQLNFSTEHVGVMLKFGDAAQPFVGEIVSGLRPLNF